MPYVAVVAVVAVIAIVAIAVSVMAPVGVVALGHGPQEACGLCDPCASIALVTFMTIVVLHGRCGCRGRYDARGRCNARGRVLRAVTECHCADGLKQMALCGLHCVDSFCGITWCGCIVRIGLMRMVSSG